MNACNSTQCDHANNEELSNEIHYRLKFPSCRILAWSNFQTIIISVDRLNGPVLNQLL
jgi:hypothetical protein